MTSSPGDEDRPHDESRLRLINLLLSAIEDNLSSLQRLLSQVHGEVEDLLRDDKGSSDGEINALRREIEQLRSALKSRPVIERAKGVLMQRHRLSQDESFALLTEESQRRRKKLREIAADVASGAALSLPAQEPAAPRTTLDDAVPHGSVHVSADVGARVPTLRGVSSAGTRTAAGSPG